jgi:hypothetical protein
MCIILRGNYEKGFIYICKLQEERNLSIYLPRGERSHQPVEFCHFFVPFLLPVSVVIFVLSSSL